MMNYEIFPRDKTRRVIQSRVKRQFVQAASVGRVLLVLLVRDFSVASHHQLLLFPLRKEHDNDNKQINSTCRRTDKP